MLVRGQVQQQLPPTRCDNACSSPSHPQGRSRCARLGTASPAAPHQTAGSRCPAVAAAAVARSSSRAQSPSTTLRENKVSLTATRKPSEKSSGTTIHQNRLRRHHGLLRSSGTELMSSSSSSLSSASPPWTCVRTCRGVRRSEKTHQRRRWAATDEEVVGVKLPWSTPASASHTCRPSCWPWWSLVRSVVADTLLALSAAAAAPAPTAVTVGDAAPEGAPRRRRPAPPLLGEVVLGGGSRLA